VNPEDTETWRRALLRLRNQKDEFFKNDHNSPFSHSAQGWAGPLKYFDPEPAFRFEVRLDRTTSTDSTMMATSKGSRQLFNRVGHFDISIDGDEVRLFAYQSAERDVPHLFIPFRDQTSGGESYGAARYLDLEVEHDDNYALDFNYAYNPYCAYSEEYVCPLPPTENWLKVAIRAGEKKYHD